ncbi:hypothetical protein OIU79_025694 [Salix purpurea]|uniref:Conserved oligomeric Golgi complex subunit 2 n=1 Tax=Salix purpurea TaxID=77065 RepID=A0A9Q0W820_SALPP|nr:hypothetical protein OIU79_025694 [Salix purpurea]
MAVDPIQTPPPPQPRSNTYLFSDPLDSHPLWFKPDLFLSPNFDSDSYISELRTFVPFDTLRSELQAHLTSLNHELIDLINRDYTDFVNLSTKLVDVDSAVVRMRAPLLELREKIEGFRGSVDSSLVALKNGLEQRSEAAATREVLELLLDTFHVVSKVEKLIKELPSVPADWSNGDVNLAQKSVVSNGSIENGTNVRETQSMLLERIASEMNRLKFYIAHAQNLPFIQNMEKRIQSASLLLDASLGHCFVGGLEHRDESEWLLGSSGDGLENDYQEIKTCINEGCKFLLEISSAENSGLHVFDFLANSILKETSWSILKAIVHPDLQSLNFRAEAIYNEFMKQWNVGVYFSLRFQEIAGALDSALAATSLIPVHNSHSGHQNSQDLTLRQSVTLLESLRSCWREDVLIFSCADKFLRLTLQLLSRFSNWLSSGLDARKTGNTSSSSGYEWAASAVPNDFLYIIHDINCLVTEVCGDYLDQVLQLLSSCSINVLDLVKKSILQGGQSLNGLIPLVINAITEALVDESVKGLKDTFTLCIRIVNSVKEGFSGYGET